MEHTSEDIALVRPNKVVVGDYFNYKNVRYTVIGIDANILAFVFTGLDMSVPDGKYAQFITMLSGRFQRIQPLDIEGEPLS